MLYDEKRVTVTASKSDATLLQQQLRAAGLVVARVGLRGRFHWSKTQIDTEAVEGFCDSHTEFRFPEASQLVLPTRSNTTGDYITQGSLNQIVLHSMLVDQCNWYDTFKAVQQSTLADEKSLVISFGPDRCVPPSLMRKLGPKLIHIADLDMTVPGAAAPSSLDPEAPINSDEELSEYDIAVVGMSLKTAGADNLEEFWKILCEGKSQHKEVPKERFGFETAFRDVDAKRKWYGNFINDHDCFDHKFFKKSPREMASTDPQQRLMLQAAYQAVEQSGYFQSLRSDNHIGCYIGVGTVDYESNIACYPANAFSATGNLKSFVAGKISHYFGWTGPGLTIDTACSASAVAVHQACKAILSGECSAALAGGATIMTTPNWFQNLAGASFLSPTGPCKPFDAKADGYCRGEGIGAVFLKRMSSAIADGDQILGTIAGSAVYQNENCTPITVPNAKSLSNLFRNVTQQARLQPSQVSVVEAHGTGTPVGDPAEYDSVRQVFGAKNRSDTLSLGSVKGLIGHAECASGIVALIKTILMVQEAIIPPQASFETLNPSIDAKPDDNMEVTTKLKPWTADFRAALINNYGASGSNASMVVTQAPRVAKAWLDSAIHTSGLKQPFWIAGFDNRSLQAYAARLVQTLKTKLVSSKAMTLANIAYNSSRQSNHTLGRSLIFSCSTFSELEEKLTGFAKGGGSISPTQRQTARPAILCFGGQVSTFVGLDRQVYDGVKIFRHHLDQCNTICQALGLGGIYPDIFQRSHIEDIVKLQICLLAMQYSCAKSWIDCGVQVAGVVGHSFGELTALCISEALSLEDAIKMIAGRARVIKEMWGSDSGAMMAVEGDEQDVVKLLADSAGRLKGEQPATIACYNGPRSFTLAGSTKSIDAVEQTAASSDVASSMRRKRLSVTNAFHSVLVDPLVPKLHDLGRELKFREPTVPFERATHSECSDPLNADFVATHMRNPVCFNHAVQRLAKKHSSAIWLEAGSNSTISMMASKALGSPKDSHFQCVNLTSDSSIAHLADATTSLWNEGLNVKFWAHNAVQSSEYSPIILPPYQFDKTSHWMELKKPQKATAIEMKAPVVVKEELPTNLWTFAGYQDNKERYARFRINTMIQKYEDYVSGHTIAQAAPLCPSTLQLDIVIEALRELRPDYAEADLYPQLQDLENHSPMCIDSSRLVWLDVETEDANSYDWRWKMISNAGEGTSPETLHVSGRLLFRSIDEPQLVNDFARYDRFTGHKRCLNLLESSDVDDAIQGRNVYKSFAEIVDYGEVYRGVQKVVGKGLESAGRVVKKYTGESWLDTPLCDSFCQVAGIYVNLMTDKPDSDICISNGIEKWIRSPKLRSGDSRPEVWDIFAQHDRPNDKQWTSDVFIFDSRNGALAEVILGISYTRVSKAGLSKMLARLTPGMKSALASPPSVKAGLPKTQETKVELPKAKTKAPKSPKAAAPKKAPQTDITGKTRDLVANVAGLEPHELQEDTVLFDIGIDSLMGMELAKEIEIVFKCTLDMGDLVDITDFKSLIACIQKTLGSTTEDIVLNEEDVDDVYEDSDDSDLSERFDDFTAPTSVAGVDITEFLSDLIGCDASDVTSEAQLIDLGVDSLLGAELHADILAKFGIHLPEDATFLEIKVSELDAKINGRNTRAAKSAFTPGTTVVNTRVNSPQDSGVSTPKGNLNIPTSVLMEAFGETKALTDQFVADNKFGNYAHIVLPRQTEMCIAHVVEAFDKLGYSLRDAKPGQKLDRIPHIPKHQRFVDYLYSMLEKDARLIDIDGDQITRTAIAPPTKSAQTLCDDLVAHYPDHADDHKLTHRCGSKLAECLEGKEDGIRLIFGSSEGRDLVSGLYGRSPINMVWLRQMENFIERLASKLPMHEGTLKIMEMGAGTGGTTTGMATMLARLNIPVEYTFSDLSPSLVAQARRRFKQYPFMNFRVHDVEKPPATELLQSQHIVISNNCVHATHSLTNSTKCIRETLRPDGFLMMVEMTSTLYWVDMVFGLFEGWWLFDDGRTHAVTHQSIWEKSMQEVGFGHIDWTDGNSPEASIQRIIIALASGSRYDRLPIPPKSMQTTDCVARQKVVDDYIQRFSTGFKVPVRAPSPPPVSPGQCVLVTGATGSLGCHLVAHFAEQPDIKTVVCLNRRSNSNPARRQNEAIQSRGITLSSAAHSKLNVIETDTTKLQLGLSPPDYDSLASSVTHIVHNAWPMSIKRPVKGFESQMLVMRHLIDLAREIACRRSTQVGFQFISSIATVGYYPLHTGHTTVPEERMTVDSVLPSGYGDAKLVCERMLDETLHQYPQCFRPMVVRIGQISGSVTSGYWNMVEHFAFLVKSSQTLRAIPDFDGMLSWCPVNTVAATLGDLLLADNLPYPIYHIENPVRQPWKEMVPVLADALGIPDKGIVPFEEWCRRVRSFPGSPETENLAAKLIDFLEDNFVRMSCHGLVLGTEKSREHSRTLANSEPVGEEVVKKYVTAWKEMAFLR